MRYFQPNTEKQNGIFNYLSKSNSHNLSYYVTIFAHPRLEDCELYTAIHEDSYDRFRSNDDEDSDIFIHINYYKIKITHFAIHYIKQYFYTTSWSVYDQTHAKNNLIGTTDITECGTNSNCNSEFIKIVPTTDQPIIDTLFFDPGLRSDEYNIAEFKSLEIYGYLIPKYESCLTLRNSNLRYILFFVFLIL